MSYRKNSRNSVFAHPVFIMKTDDLVKIKTLLFRV